jgi:hypothetical protein
MLTTIGRIIIRNINVFVDNSVLQVLQRFRPLSLQYAVPIHYQEETQVTEVSWFDQAALWFAAPKSKVFRRNFNYFFATKFLF